MSNETMPMCNRVGFLYLFSHLSYDRLAAINLEIQCRIGETIDMFIRSPLFDMVSERGIYDVPDVGVCVCH